MKQSVLIKPTFSRFGHWLASGFNENTKTSVALWDVEQGKRVYTFGKFKSSVTDTEFSPNEKMLAVIAEKKLYILKIGA